MNHRLTLACAIAVILASISEFSLINGVSWLVAAAGAVLVVALAGTLTRLNAVPAAIGATVLAVIASVPLLTAPSAYLKAAGLVIVAACAVSATRLRFLTPLASLVTYLAALLLYLNALFGGPKSVVRVVPTTASLRHLLAVFNQGTTTATGPAPVPGTHGVLLLAAGGIGLAAIAVDLLAVRLRRPAIAGLPLLVVFMAPVPTAARIGSTGGAFAFLCAATGYLALLSADGRNRLRGWGRVVTVWHYAGEDERLGGAEVGALAATGRRIGLAAVCVAVATPLLLPTLNLHRLLAGGTGPGNVAQVSLPNPVDQLDGMLTKSAGVPVLSYRTVAVGPGAAQFQPAEQYLQVYVLNYDPSSRSWQPIWSRQSTAVHRQPLQPPQGTSASAPVLITQTAIRLGPVAAGYVPAGSNSPLFFLPVPYWPYELQLPGSWQESNGTLMIYSAQDSHPDMSYSVTSEDPDPAPAMLSGPQQIPASIRQSYLGYPTTVTSQLSRIADYITRGKQNAFTKAKALQDWFLSGQFAYTLRPHLPNTPAGLLTFLTKSKQGYCQQFAFAFAVLARLVGIPSRIAIGYTAGEEGKNGVWQVTTNDGHAWPELYFQNVGWIRFEPTPGGIYGQGTAAQPSYLASHSSSQTGPTGPGSKTNPATGPAGSITKIHPPHLQAPEPAGGKSPAAGSLGRHQLGDLPLIIVATILALVAVAPGITRVLVRRWRWHGATTDAGLARVAWQEIRDDLDDFGLPCRDSESPRAVARRVCSAAEIDDAARQAVGRIASVVERVRYAPDPAAVGPIRADVALVRRALGRSAGLTVRWRARLLPASTLGPVRSAVRQGVGLLTGWMPSTRENAPA